MGHPTAIMPSEKGKRVQQEDDDDDDQEEPASLLALIMHFLIYYGIRMQIGCNYFLFSLRKGRPIVKNWGDTHLKMGVKDISCRHAA